jgi:hypothetical protein
MNKFRIVYLGPSRYEKGKLTLNDLKFFNFSDVRRFIRRRPGIKLSYIQYFQPDGTPIYTLTPSNEAIWELLNE